jgi:hypothetical protein
MGETGRIGKGPESATTYGHDGESLGHFQYPTRAPRQTCFLEVRLRRWLKRVVCSSNFRPFGGGSPMPRPLQKGLDQPDTAKITGHACDARRATS